MYLPAFKTHSAKLIIKSINPKAAPLPIDANGKKEFYIPVGQLEDDQKIVIAYVTNLLESAAKKPTVFAERQRDLFGG